MLLFILRRFAVMVFTALCLTFIVFFMTNLYPNLEKLAKSEGNFRMDDAAVASFLDNRGYLDPLPIKYGRWLGVLPGYVIQGSDGKTRGQCFERGTDGKGAPRFCGVLQGLAGHCGQARHRDAGPDPVAGCTDRFISDCARRLHPLYCDPGGSNSVSARGTPMMCSMSPPSSSERGVNRRMVMSRRL